MADLASLVRSSLSEHGSSLEVSLFRTSSPEVIADLLRKHLQHSGKSAVDALFYRRGVGLVVGFELADGSPVVLKVHRWNAERSRLTAVLRVQHALSERLASVPRSLAGPDRLGTGLATLEQYRPATRANGHEPAVRRNVANALHTFVEAGRGIDATGLGTPVVLTTGVVPLWPEPHDVRFDFAASSRGAEWIDEAAVTARRRLAGSEAQAIIGHLDWRTENLGFLDGVVVAIYDWDSLAIVSEAMLVGATAAQFCADWQSANALPSVDEMRDFVDDYEQQRGRRFNREDLSALDGANLALIAYGARCQHSDMLLHPDLGGTPDDGWQGLLNARGVAPLWQGE